MSNEKTQVRVLTVDELQQMDGCVWIEHYTEKDLENVYYWKELSDELGCACFPGNTWVDEEPIDSFSLEWNAYNKATECGWRCWSDHPTDARRYDTKWEPTGRIGLKKNPMGRERAVSILEYMAEREHDRFRRDALLIAVKDVNYCIDHPPRSRRRVQKCHKAEILKGERVGK